MRKGNTRSHTELGSQAFQRRWYFVLRHGRVGHCQAKKLMKIASSLKSLKKRDLNSKRIIIEIDENYIRPLDVNSLLGNARKARKKLRWQPKEKINQLIDEMIYKENKLIDNDQ